MWFVLAKGIVGRNKAQDQLGRGTGLAQSCNDWEKRGVRGAAKAAATRGQSGKSECLVHSRALETWDCLLGRLPGLLEESVLWGKNSSGNKCVRSGPTPC